MNEEPIHNPHDRFVRYMLGRPETAAAYLRQQLPAEVVAQLNLSGLRPLPQSFIDQTLREGLSDLVFEVPLVEGGEALAVILFEHKSHPDAMTVFQILRYIVRILEQRLRDGLPLCCVIPLVLYHGEQPWNVARSMDQLIAVPEPLRPYVPRFSLPLLDLSRFPEEQLREESIVFVLLSVLKYSRREELAQRLEEAFRIVAQGLERDSALQMLEAILRYVVSVSSTITPDALRASFTRGVANQPLLIEGLSLMPTIAEQWLQQGIEKGIEQGIEKGIEQGRQKGRQEGTAHGELIGRIRAFQEVLGQPVDSLETLAVRDEGELRQLAEQLKAALSHR